jgi:hypothetical protein
MLGKKATIRILSAKAGRVGVLNCIFCGRLHHTDIQLALFVHQKGSSTQNSYWKLLMYWAVKKPSLWGGRPGKSWYELLNKPTEILSKSVHKNYPCISHCVDHLMSHKKWATDGYIPRILTIRLG